MSFIKELKRRNVFRVMLAYAVAAWLLVEGMQLLSEIFGAPDWVMKIIIGALLFGFLPVLVFSWVYEITPDGIRKESSDKPEHTAESSRKLDIAVLVMLSIAIAFAVYDRFGGVAPVAVPPPSAEQSQVTTSEGPPMLAVLPFVTASLDGESEFFATGVHDDLLTQLAQLQSIRVISRTSVLEYKDTVKNIREIGRELGVDAILEGGVQSAGNRIRINVQLIDAKTDVHLWAHTYDRELSPANIFDVQTEIANAITAALHTTLTVQDTSQMVAPPTENMAAYRAYHQAMEIRDSKVDWITPYVEKLEEAIALDPTFTRALAELVGHFSYRNFGAEDEPELIRRAEQMLENIRTLAPNSADNLIAQAYYTYYTLKDFDRAGHLITQAELMMPSDVRLLELKTWIQRRQGDFDGRTETIRKIQKLDPRNSQWTRILIANLVVTHRYEEAQQEIESATFDDYRLEQWRNILQLRAHHDVDKWADNWLTLQQEFEGDAGPSDRWEAFIAKRDYVAAEEILDEILAPAVPDGQRPTLSIRQASMIITYWFQKRSDLLPELLAQNRAQLERSRNPDDGYIPSSLYMDLALVSMAEGDADEAKRMVRRWHRLINDDLAELTRMRYHSCQILGMAAATAEAVKCIRTGLVEPSTIMPFMEPFLPYYDSIRDEPAFVELLAELQAAAENPKQSPYYR